jgi:dipeptidyl aminopeptidase/acylaminoacyl peptidase
VLYPREPHGFQERAHQIDLHKRMGAWVDKYLFA